MIQKPLQVQGKFIEDSVKIGQTFRYTVWTKHPQNQEILFPSMEQRFGEFEPVKRDYFVSKTKGNTSLDSAVYTFRLFDLRDTHILHFPIYLMDGQDCTLISPQPDTIFLKRLVKNPEKINLDSLYSQIEIPLLSPRTELKNILSWSIGSFVLLSIVYWLFGNKIKQTFKLYLLWRKNLDFRRAFQRYNKNITNSSVGLRNLEKAFTLWKNYLEKLTHIPFSTFTTKEMLDNLNVKHLDKSLNEMDSAIYGGNFTAKTIESLNFLMGIANNIYETKRRKIKLENKKR
jgi:hypothetical protein